jgi:mannose/fructose/N-acetylgalactosamine-specific phosphotransferase system component IIC
VTLLSVSCLYSLLALDHIAVGQFMLSRPLVVGPLVGYAFGSPALGVMVGIIAELLWVNVIPVGFWSVDVTSVTALAVAWGLLSVRPGQPAVMLAFLLAVPAGIIIRRIDIFGRHQTRRVLPWLSKRLSSGQENAALWAHVLAVAAWWLKGAVVFFCFGLLGQPLVNAILIRLTDPWMAALTMTSKALILVSLAAVLNHFYVRLAGEMHS